jgi:hypothetical protein
VSRVVAVVLAAIFGLSFWNLAPELREYPLALLLLLSGWSVVVRYLQEGGRWRPLRAGVLFGLAAIFKHDVSALATAGSCAAVWLGWWAARRARPAAWEPPLFASLSLGLGALAVVVPVAALLAVAAGPDAFEDLIVFPATVFRDVRSEPYAPLLPPLQALREWLWHPENLRVGRDTGEAFEAWILCNLPLAVYLGSVVFLWRRGPRLAATTRAVILLCLSLMPLYFWAAHTQQNTHLYTMGAFSLLLIGMAWTGCSSLDPRGRRMLRWALGATVAAYALGLWLTPAMLVAGRFAESGTHMLDVPVARGVRVPHRQFAYLDPIVRLVLERTEPDERIYAGVQRHDAIVINNRSFYYLTGRRGATRYPELHPGVTDLEGAQREIIEDLERHGVRCVILWHFGWPDERLDRIRDDRASRVPGIGATLLDEFLAENFESIATHGDFEVLWRRDDHAAPRVESP